MIYLIDDKVERQRVDYHRFYTKVKEYSDLFCSIETLEEYRKKSAKILGSDNIILLHESFAKGSFNDEKAELNTFIEDEANVLVFFGGSINQCSREGNKAWLPVDTFYQNLEIFLNRYKLVDRKPRTDLIDHLFYGNHPEVERELATRLKESVLDFLNGSVAGNRLQTDGEKILYCYERKDLRGWPKIFAQASEVDLVDLNLHATERGYATFLEEIKCVKYDRIFIPLCFGYALSDYNGLLLALHIRCTTSPNRLTSICLYGPFDIKSVMANTFSGVLRLSNVHHIEFSEKGFTNGLRLVNQDLPELSFVDEIRNVRLQLPASYADEHSLANEYGALVFARAAGIEDELSYEFRDLEADIYYKWLLTCHTPWHKKIDDKKTPLFQPGRTKLPGVRVVGKIDLPR